MKKYCLGFLLFTVISNFGFISAQSTNILFEIAVENTEQQAISRVYVKIFVPDQTQAVDSFFTDNQGVINRELPFTFESDPNSVENHSASRNIIIQDLYPNLITQENSICNLHYNYEGNPELFFLDVHGRSYPNNFELSEGVYLYYLKFPDGMRSEIKRLVVLERSQVNVNLISETDNKNFTKKAGNSFSSDNIEKFYASFIKDGYVTHTDTIALTSAIVEKKYSLSKAEVPTASFANSGNLTTGNPVLFDASASVAANGENLNYSWDFGNGKRGQSLAIPHVFSTPGNYIVTLTVTGDYGASSTYSKEITVSSIPAVTEDGMVRGYITDINNNALSGVSITHVEGDGMAVSNDFGVVDLSALPVNVPLHFRISKNGFVNQIVALTIPTDTKEALFFVALNYRNQPITLQNAEFGGEVEGSDGAFVQLPLEGLQREDGSAVTGNIEVYITPVNVAQNIESFPGTFNAFTSAGADGVLLSYGVSEFLFQQNGERLNLAPGKKATILIPIYTSGASIGDEILLWSVNEDNGIWVQEGTGMVVSSNASPTGLALEAEVGHFSWWNCDDFTDPDERTGLCWRTECDAGFCRKVAVGCWLSGSQDGTNLKSANMLADVNAITANQGPVFEVRGYIPETGKSLRFPMNRNVYMEARAFGPNGELMLGSYNMIADDPGDFEIELLPANAGDTIDLALNDTVNAYLEPDQYLHYRLNITEGKIYNLLVAGGDTPTLKGLYSVKDSRGVLFSGTLKYSSEDILLPKGQVIISVSGQNQSDEGNFRIGITKSVEAIAISMNDSIYVSIDSHYQKKLYQISSSSRTVLEAHYYRAEGSSVKGRLYILSSRGIEIADEALGSNTTMLSAIFEKDSTYYILVEGSNNTGDFILLTKDEKPIEVSYGDTLNNSLVNKNDIDLYQFDGQKNDFVVIKGDLPVYQLKNGMYSLLDSKGLTLISSTIVNKGNEIIYEIPEDGLYSIKIYNTSIDTGSYQIVLRKDSLQTIPFNSFSEFVVEQDNDYYFEFNVPSKSLVHLSLQSDKGSGRFEVKNPEGEMLLDNKVYKQNYYQSYFGEFAKNKYYMKVSNKETDTIFVNMLVPESLEFNEKNKASRQDTIHSSRQVNVYGFTGSHGQGFHEILHEYADGQAPANLDIDYYRMSSGSLYTAYLSPAKISYTSLDSTILHESGASLAGSRNDSWIMVTYGESKGKYMLDVHLVDQQKTIVVDDDFAEYPDAQTSSLIAAGYAVTTGGEILIANGKYPSYLPVKIIADSVLLHGQTRENVEISSVYGARTTLFFDSKGGTIKNLTFSTGLDPNPTGIMISLSKDGIVMEDVTVKPLPGFTNVVGKIRGSGNNYVFRNISMNSLIGDGMDITSENLLIENCDINAKSTAIHVDGGNSIIRNNTIICESTNSAIQISSAKPVGNSRVENNTITMNSTASSTSGAAIYMSEKSPVSVTNTSYVRNNQIITNGAYYGIIASVGNPPSKIIIENNSIRCLNVKGGRAISMQGGRSDGSSSIIVRNNIFDGLVAYEALDIMGLGYLVDGQEFALLNNNFRIASGAQVSPNSHFIKLSGQGSTVDTVDFYMANNIFEGNGLTSLMDFQSAFTIYSDYNIVYKFGKYINDIGAVIGTSNDISLDPLFTDNFLQVGAGSPAIDSGASPTDFLHVPAFDFNGIARPQGTGYDIGAYEKE